MKKQFDETREYFESRVIGEDKRVFRLKGLDLFFDTDDNGFPMVDIAVPCKQIDFKTVDAFQAATGLKESQMQEIMETVMNMTAMNVISEKLKSR